MSTFEDDDPRVGGPRFYGMRIGRVVKRDPGAKRIKFVIEGFIEPESVWARPLTSMAGGSAGVGAVGLPRIGAEVAIWFANGDIETPYYMPAGWGTDEVPPEVQGIEEATIWSSENFAIVMDDTPKARKLRIVSRKTAGIDGKPQDLIEIDAEDNSVTIRATTALNLNAVGIISINAANVLIKGRKVVPTDESI